MKNNNNIFDTSEIIILQNALGSQNIGKSAYACFDGFDDSKKKLTLGEKKLCLEFSHIIDTFSLGIQDIVDFTNSIDYEKLFIKNICYINLDCYGYGDSYAFFRNIEDYGYAGTLRVEIASFTNMKKDLLEIDIESLKLMGLTIKRKVDIGAYSFEIHCNQENFLEIYTFVSQICSEVYSNPIVSEYDHEDIESVDFSYIVDDPTEINQQIFINLKKLGLDDESIKTLESEKINRFSLEVYFLSEKSENTDDEFYDDIVDEDFQEVDEEPEFIWSENKIEILAYLDHLLQTKPLPKLVLVEHFDN